MKIFPQHKFLSGEDLQPDTYLNPEFQSVFGVANTQIDSENILVRELQSPQFEQGAWIVAQNLSASGLDTITVVSASEDFISFDCVFPFTSPEGFLTGGMTLVYSLYSVFEPTGSTAIDQQYTSAQYRSSNQHSFGLYLDGSIISSTDNIGQGTVSTVNIQFSAPIEAGSHSIEVKIKVPKGTVNVSADVFTPLDYAYCWLMTRRR